MKSLQRLAIALVASCCCVTATAQDPELRPGRLDRETRDALQPGLKVELVTGAVGALIWSDTYDSRLAALYVAEGEPASPFLPGRDRFRADFTGYFKTRLRSEHQFSFRGQGHVLLQFNDEDVIEIPDGDLSAAKPVTVELVKGYNKIHIRYISSPGKDAAMRLYWASDEFPAEPVPPTMLMHDGRDERWLEGQRLRQGRLLLARHQCIQCHAPSDELAEMLIDTAPADSTAMPELFRQGPSLNGVGSRLDAAWMAKWIEDPTALRNKTTMPAMLNHLMGDDRGQAAADLAAFLSQQKLERPWKPFADDLVRQGESLWEDRGCIACHRFTDVVDEDDEYDRLSLNFASQKFQPNQLAIFLQDTRHHHAWSRMPKFKLPAAEAAALEAYIRHRSKGELEKPADGDAARGKELFTEVGCANCHELDSALKATGGQGPKLAKLDLGKGCLADAVEGARRGPLFPLDDPQRAAIVSFLSDQDAQASLQRRVPHEFSRRQFDEIGCTSCHRRDDTDADLPYVLLDESEIGRQPENIPDLTWAGDKLRPQWTLRQFHGELGYRPRPHFRAHMPAFPMRGELLSLGISAEHGFAPKEDPRPKFDADLAKVGEQVAAMHTGLACHRCHAIGDKQATAPFEARSTNLSFAAERLRYPYYHRWMRDPMRVDPSTKMIKFAQDGKKTGLTKFYDGDARQQFESIWHWLQVLNEEERK